MRLLGCNQEDRSPSKIDSTLRERSCFSARGGGGGGGAGGRGDSFL